VTRPTSRAAIAPPSTAYHTWNIKDIDTFEMTFVTAWPAVINPYRKPAGSEPV
jgi:hypothetical protein